MSGESFEWAIKKDVRNNPIVREVDRERHREMWRSVGFSMFFVVAVLFATWQHFALLQYGYLMGDSQELLEKEERIGRQLRLELEMRRAPQVIEKIATEQLRMVTPGADDAPVIERVVEPAEPPMSVVAQR